MKIVSSGKALHSPGFLKKKQRNKKIKLIVTSVSSVLFLVFVIYLAHNDRFLISGVKVSGENVTDHEEIASIAQSTFKGSYLYILPRSNTLIYPRNKIKESILKEFPRLKTVALGLEGLNILTVDITERAPKAVYCSTSTECFLVDDGGFIFAEAPSFSEGVYLVFITNPAIESPVGKTLMSRENFVLVTNFVEKLSPLGIHASKLEVREDDYALILHNGGEVIWKRDADLSIIYSNLEAFLSDEAIEAQTNFLDRISRLDLRTDNKVFYRFRNE